MQTPFSSPHLHLLRHPRHYHLLIQQLQLDVYRIKPLHQLPPQQEAIHTQPHVIDSPLLQQTDKMLSVLHRGQPSFYQQIHPQPCTQTLIFIPSSLPYYRHIRKAVIL